MCALFLSTTAPLPIHAADGVDDLPDIAAALPLLTDDLAAEVPVPTPVVVPTEAPTAVPTAAPTPEPTPAPTTAAVVRVAAPRPVNAFVYGTHISALDHAATARQDGFRLMWGYVSWQQVEPNRGDFLFRKQDKWGKPLPNALTNVINCGRSGRHENYPAPGRGPGLGRRQPGAPGSERPRTVSVRNGSLRQGHDPVRRDLQ